MLSRKVAPMRPPFLILSAGVLLLAACGPAAAPDQAAEPAAAGDWIAPPRVTTVTARADGGFTVSGETQPDVRVRLAARDGAAYGATSDARGVFTIALPSSAAPQLLAMSMEVNGRPIGPRGRLFLPPAGDLGAALLSPGAPTASLLGERLLAAVDYDQGGGLAVSGRAEAGAEVRVAVDGAVMATGRAGSDGRYGLTASGAVPAGPHLITVQSGGQSAEQRLDLAAVAGGSE
ncbi:MAG TPA: Ig-like domain-containing protein, partial [Caulobacteraceae bacterium]